MNNLDQYAILSPLALAGAPLCWRHTELNALAKPDVIRIARKSSVHIAGGCFAKGTLVHTEDGLKPVEEIKVGDSVLSSPEDGSGIPEYKQVLRTFVYEQKTIVKIAVATEDPATSETIAATGNHPFWVEGLGWTRADALATGSLLRKADGEPALVVRQTAVYRTGRVGVGWVADLKNIAESHGSVFDYANYAVVERREEDKYLSDEVLESEDPYLRVSVYNIEVEDFHTYFVGAEGYWVHNRNCEGVRLENGKGNCRPLPHRVTRGQGFWMKPLWRR